MRTHTQLNHWLVTERMIVVSEWYDDNLENHIKSGEFVKPRPLAKLANQVLEALTYLSNHDIVHRGLSPDNILLTPQVGGTMVVVCNSVLISSANDLLSFLMSNEIRRQGGVVGGGVCVSLNLFYRSLERAKSRKSYI